MYEASIDKFANQALRKVAVLEQRPLAIWIGGLLAGAYVGLGIILIMTLGNEVAVEMQKLVMGATFGIALTLVTFAGAELFTGYAMYCAVAVLKSKLQFYKAVKICVFVWVANLMGAIVLVAMYKMGGGVIVESADTVLQKIAYKKMNADAVELLFNGILCNWLVCLAVWMSARMTSDAAKCIAIFWCLLAFIVSGFEHSVANMTVFSLALVGPVTDGLSVAGAAWSLLWVTLGNAIGGAVFVGAAYWYMSEPGESSKRLSFSCEEAGCSGLEIDR